MIKAEEVYRQVRPEREALERKRLKILWRKENFVWYIVILFLFVCIFLGFQLLLPELSYRCLGFYASPLVITAMAALTSVLFYGFFITVPIADFKRQFKAQVVRRVADLRFGLKFAPHKGIARKTFVDSRIFSQGFNRYEGGDLLYGKIGKTDIWISELKVSYAYYNQLTRRTEEVLIFKGIFFVADFHKHFHGRSWVLPYLSKYDMKLLGRSTPGITVKDLELVRLEDPEFDRMFKVVGTDQVEARYILSPGMMQRIKEIRQFWRQSIYLSFFDSVVAMALPTNYDFFEADLNKPLTGNSEEFRRILEEISLWQGFVEELNLNTRIWSKE